MSLQQVLDAPQQLEDIFDTSDSLWEAERVLQVVLDRVGRHVERLVVSENENRDSIQSCLALILAAADFASGEEPPVDPSEVNQGRQEENAVPQLPRFTRGGIPIRAETSHQEGGLLAWEWTGRLRQCSNKSTDPTDMHAVMTVAPGPLVTQISSAARIPRTSARSIQPVTQAQQAEFQPKVTPLVVQQPSYEHYERLREEIEKRRRQAQKKAEKLAKEAKERADIEKLHQELRNQEYTYDSSGKVVVMARPDSSPRTLTEPQYKVISNEAPQVPIRDSQGVENIKSKLNLANDLEFVSEKPSGQAAVFENIKLAPGCTVKQGQSAKKGQPPLEGSERLTRKAFRRLQHASQRESPTHAPARSSSIQARTQACYHVQHMLAHSVVSCSRLKALHDEVALLLIQPANARVIL